MTTKDKMIAADIAHHFASLREAGVKPKPATVWDTDRMGAEDLIQVLEAGDVDAIATTLSGMFHSRYIQGMEHGYRHKAEPISTILVPTLIEDRLVSLAEYLGTCPAETPEQGIPALALKDGLEPVVAGLEKALGYRLAFPEDMGESGIRVGGRLLTQRQVAHIHMSVCMKQALTNFGGGRDAYKIVEIGGGYGGLCYWSFKTFADRLTSYIIIDLPWVNAIQGFFLKKTMRREAVAFCTDPPEIIAQARVLICSASHYRGIAQLTGTDDLYVNQDSFPEMPEEVLDDYLDFLKTKTGALLLSQNQENGSAINGIEQGNPSQRIQARMNVRRFTRTLSALREGYAEELYRIL